MSGILEKAQVFVTELLTLKLDNNYMYHNLRHTERVVKNTKEIINHSAIDDTDAEMVLLAAWFHDTGFTKGHEDHEEKSCKIASAFLKKEQYDALKTERVCQYIMATRNAHHPEDLMEEIIRDADSSHFASDSYNETSEILREELKRLNIRSYSISEWRNANIDMFVSGHQYYTDYAKKNWQEGKDRNLEKLIKDRKKIKQIEKKEALKVSLKSESPERGIQTLYRVTLRNHLKLSDIADTKANILLSVNAIIISLALANLIPKLDNPSNSYLFIPTVVFLFFGLVSMVLSVLATRPNITRGEFTMEDIKDRKVNILFFGNFHKMELEDFETAMKDVIKDKDYLYNSLTKDLYFLGKVLDRKYRILRWTYTIFMIGIIISVVTFGVAYKLFGTGRLIETLP
ncbi:Pycsar system effector family protein [Ascidiimonas aurantiaca]|uniref:Pycsar system effector family protein n=1 Tax=Ascidiimonas aurantiaca TaxID=1685432 RepID=UPI0030EEA1D2